VTLDIRAHSETLGVSASQLAALFGRDKSTLSAPLECFDDGELVRASVVADFATTAEDGNTYQVTHYDLDVVISVGYRVKSASCARHIE
jgi:hypothetical protein